MGQRTRAEELLGPQSPPSDYLHDSQIIAREHAMRDEGFCDECGAVQPEDVELIGPHHEDSCSLHPDNIVDPQDPQPND